MKLSVTLSGVGFLFGGDLRAVVEMARAADDLGIDQLVVPDHVVMGPHTEHYPYGRFPLPADEPWPEPLTLLAAVAATTHRMRLGTGILIAPLRPPLLLAKTAATLDALCAGRLDLGVGVGWQREEFVAGVAPFEERWRSLDEGLRACRALWGSDPSAVTWRGVETRELRAFPKPVQAGGVPLWFGVAATERQARRMAELGEGWMPMDGDPKEIAAGLETIRPALLAAGRDPDAFGVRAHAPLVMGDDRRPDLEATLRGLPALAEAGATVASFALAAFCRSPDEIRPFLERLGREASA